MPLDTVHTAVSNDVLVVENSTNEEESSKFFERAGLSFSQKFHPRFEWINVNCCLLFHIKLFIRKLTFLLFCTTKLKRFYILVA